MTESATESIQADATIDELITEAQDDLRTEHQRDVWYLFFRPLSIQMHGGRYPAFGRDISVTGIGLLHKFEMTAREIEIHIRSKRGQLLRARTRITWCRLCGEGWYVSRGDFVGIPNAEQTHQDVPRRLNACTRIFTVPDKLVDVQCMVPSTHCHHCPWIRL